MMMVAKELTLRAREKEVREGEEEECFSLFRSSVVSKMLKIGVTFCLLCNNCKHFHDLSRDDLKFQNSFLYS